jgi:hypothetical protein
MQLLLAAAPSIAMAQDLNIQSRMNDMMPPPQVQTPDFNVGRPNQPNAARAARTTHKVQKKQTKNQ